MLLSPSWLPGLMLVRFRRSVRRLNVEDGDWIRPTMLTLSLRRERCWLNRRWVRCRLWMPMIRWLPR